MISNIRFTAGYVATHFEKITHFEKFFLIWSISGHVENKIFLFFSKCVDMHGPKFNALFKKSECDDMIFFFKVLNF